MLDDTENDRDAERLPSRAHNLMDSTVRTMSDYLDDNL